MKPRKTQREIALSMARDEGVLRARDARSAGVSSTTLTRLVRSGELVRADRGLYELPDADVSEHHTLAEVARRVPHGVVCLLSALAFHDLTTELPFDVWLAHRRGSRPPTIRSVKVRLFRYSKASFEHGVEVHDIDGVPVRITTPAKTVADCFKFRSRVGLDVAMAALRDYVRKWAGTMDELWEAARVCRVHNVLRPYLEMVA
ncbi:MAG: type IV toxin-antitoxin system AbiEi family antitoxin domain-containing protein [Deltaproteobacteria bacterium]|nr:type IV toxin-antitoxin system AbiEi family antitoxin domain-containing protein [Deltaproteobacteria bacterium]